MPTFRLFNNGVTGIKLNVPIAFKPPDPAGALLSVSTSGNYIGKTLGDTYLWFLVYA